MSTIGVIAMPANFRYREVFLKGRPRHDRYDPFRIRHPSMDRGHRAKIFSPFDALKGFNEAVAAKDEPCSDENNEAYGLRGKYKTITGICWNVDAEVNQTILIDRAKIPLGNVLKIEAFGDLFRKDWDDPWIN